MSTKTKTTSARKFSDLRAEALKDVVVTEPYPLELTDGTVVAITEPTELERTVGLAQLIQPDGSFDPAHSTRLLELFCGEDVFPQIWAEFRHDHTKVMMQLLNELIEHFGEVLERDRAAVDAPGGSDSSSS